MTAQEIRQDAIETRRDELLTVKEFAFVTKEHFRSVYRRVWKGTQPGVHRYGREIRIDIAAAGTSAPRRGRPKK